MSRDPIHVEVLAALGDVKLVERYVIDGAAPRRNFLHGQYKAGVVTINPAPSLVSILVHELIHHVRPSWSERAVTSKTTRLLREMSHDDVQALYRQYLERVS